jgi:hypothetical protein
MVRRSNSMFGINFLLLLIATANKHLLATTMRDEGKVLNKEFEATITGQLQLHRPLQLRVPSNLIQTQLPKVRPTITTFWTLVEDMETLFNVSLLPPEVSGSFSIHCREP